MIAHKTAHVDIPSDATNTPRGTILPKQVIVIAIQLRLIERIRSYEIFVFSKARIAMDVAVVKIAASIYERLDTILLLKERAQLEQSLLEHRDGHPLDGFSIDERKKILALGVDNRTEKVELRSGREMGTEEQVTAYFEPHTLALTEVVFVSVIYRLHSLRGLDVHIVHIGLLNDNIPVDTPLIVAHVYAMELLHSAVANEGRQVKRRGMAVRARLAHDGIWQDVCHIFNVRFLCLAVLVFLLCHEYRGAERKHCDE